MKRYLLASLVLLAACNSETGTDAVAPPLEPEAEAPAEAMVPAGPALASEIVITPTADIFETVRVPGKVTVVRNEDDTLTITGTNAANPGGETSGVAFPILGELETRISGSRLTVSVLAKAASDAGGQMKVVYSTNESGNSGWQDFDLGSDEFEVYSFKYVVPRASADAGSGDFLSILPATAENGLVVAAVGLDIEPLPERSSTAPAEGGE